MKILAIVGSTRADSTNRLLAQAAFAQLPEGWVGEITELPASLPFYDEDVDAPGSTPEAATELRAEVDAADALLLVTPEYNGSMSGVAKNAIDWLSRPYGSGALIGKPALVLAATVTGYGAQWAREQAHRSLEIAGAKPLEQHLGISEAHVAFEASDLSDRQVRSDLGALVAELVAAAEPSRV